MTPSESAPDMHGFAERGGGRTGPTTPTAFQRLQKRAFGGEDVAARPGVEDDDWWPQGRLLPGVDYVIQGFVDSIGSGTHLTMVFLLGGAGNGKSFAARELARRLGIPASPPDVLAERLYSTQLEGTRIEILNDATIAPSDSYHEHQAVALCTDIARWHKQSLAGPVGAFCCVNRGIAIDELRALDAHRVAVGDFAAAVLEWLASPTQDISRTLETQPTLQSQFGTAELSALSQVKMQEFLFLGRSVRIVALSVDASSLMEPDLGLQQSRARELFGLVLDRCRVEAHARPSGCPVRANVLQWIDTDATARWEELLRAAEIASGRLFSYRDVWGIVALALLGPGFVDDNGSLELEPHIDRHLARLENAASARERLVALMELAKFRSHEALFRAPVPSGSDFAPRFPPSTPPHAGLGLIDPSVWGSQDSPLVESALEAIAIGDRPSRILRASDLQLTGWSEFEATLEDALLSFVGSEDCPDTARRQLVSWFGGYVTRLVGISTGRLGNAEVINVWRECYRASAPGPAALPLTIESPLHLLLFPPHDGEPNDRVLIPAFAGRIEPLRPPRDGSAAQLAEFVTHTGLSLTVARAGGRLVLECRLAGSISVVGQMALDFPMLREALCCRVDRPGQTESSAFVEPRMERCRAASLESVPQNYRRLVAVSGAHRAELSI